MYVHREDRVFGPLNVNLHRGLELLTWSEMGVRAYPVKFLVSPFEMILSEEDVQEEETTPHDAGGMMDGTWREFTAIGKKMRAAAGRRAGVRECDVREEEYVERLCKNL